jgi:hypothetical protein
MVRKNLILILLIWIFIKDYTKQPFVTNLINLGLKLN